MALFNNIKYEIIWNMWTGDGIWQKNPLPAKAGFVFFTTKIRMSISFMAINYITEKTKRIRLSGL